MNPDPSTALSLAQAVGAGAVRELRSATDRARHCADQLTDAQIWERPAPSMNSVGHLLLHLRGNLRQWIVNGLTGAPDDRDRPSEFAEQTPIPKAELLARLEDVVDQACAILERLTPESLLGSKRIQGFDLDGAQVIFDTVPHFRGHVQEIVHMTRVILGDSYRIAWAPATVEQGAPAPAASQ